MDEDAAPKIEPIVQRRCAKCKELWPLAEFRVGTSSYSQHCEICRVLVRDWIDTWQETLRQLKDI